MNHATFSSISPDTFSILSAVSVIICTHNPHRLRLDRTLAALQNQTLSTDKWELLVVDNASEPPVVLDLRWHPAARHVHEPVLGLTNARLCGIREARSDLLVFVDDDNELDPGYLEIAAELASAHRQLGCIGAGVIRPEFELTPDPSLKPYLNYLALREVASDQWSNNPEDDGLTPWGAGLVIRAEVARKYAQAMRALSLRRGLGRAGKSLCSGEDDEFSWVAHSLGYGKGLFPRLSLTHLIPAERVQQDYLLRLVEGTRLSHAILDHLHGHPVPEEIPPSYRLALVALVRGRPFQALQYIREARAWSHLSPTDRAFATAMRCGREKARQLIADTQD